MPPAISPIDRSTIASITGNLSIVGSVVDVVESQTVEAPVSVVWAALADFDAISRWAPNVDHSCLTTNAAAGVGVTRRVQSGRNAVLETVIDWVPEHRLAYSIAGLPSVIRSVTNTWTLDDVAGTTEVTLTSTVDAGPRPPQKAVARMVGRLLANASRQMLDGLDRHLHDQQLEKGVS